MWRPCKQFNWVLIAGLALCAGDRVSAQDDLQDEPRQDEPRQPSSRKDLDEKDIVGYIETHIPVYGVPLRTIADAPEGFYGEVLSVPGEVGEVLSQHAFALRDPLEPKTAEVIVIVRLPLAAIERGQKVSVIGQFRPLVLTELESDYDWFERTWLRRLADDPNRRPTLVAASVVLVEEDRELLKGLQSKLEPGDR